MNETKSSSPSKQIELEVELQSLKKKEQELLEALNNVNSALTDLGLPSSVVYSVDEEANRVQAKDIDDQRKQKIKSSGLFDVRNPSKLSFRGEDKAREHFQLLNLNQNGYLGYKSFREINAFSHPYGLIVDPAYQSDIAWKIMMLNDGYSLDLVGAESNPSHQIAPSSNQTVSSTAHSRGNATADKANATTAVTATTEEPQLHREGYVRYRQELEQKYHRSAGGGFSQSFVKELDYLGMNYLPDYLLQWKKVKALIREVVEGRPFVKTFSKEDLVLLKGYLTLEEMLYIVNNLGFNFTKPEIALLMLWRRRKANVLLHLLRVYAKRNLSQQEYSFEIQDHPNKEAALLVDYDDREAAIFVEHLDKVKEEHFLAWFLACPRFISFEKLWYRRILHWKACFFRGLRKIDASCRFLFNLAAHFNDRLLFRDFPPLTKLSKYLQEVILWKTSVEIGNFELNPLTSERYPGLSLSWKLLKLENPETMLKSLQIPPGSSTVLVLEFLLRPSISAATQERLLDCLRQSLMNTVEKELKTQNLNFNGLQYSCVVNEIDENFVLRILLSYKKVVSIDRFLETLLLEYRVSDLVTSWIGELKTNFNLSNYLQHHLSSLNDTLSLQFTSTIAMRKNLIAALVKRMILGFSAGLTQDQVNALNNPNPVDSEDPRLLSESDKQKIQASSSSMTTAASATKKGQKEKSLQSLASSTATAKQKRGRVQVVAKNQSLEQEEELIRFQRWKLLYPFYGQLKQFWEGVYSTWLSSFQTSTFRYSFKSLADLRQKLAILLQDLPWLSPLISSSEGGRGGGGMWYEVYHWLSDGLLFEKGFFSRHFKAFQEDFQFEIGSLFSALTRFLEKRKSDDEERRLKALITIVPNADDASTVQEDYMKRQLLSESNKDQEDKEDSENPLEYIAQLESKQRFQDINNLRLLEICKEYILGINTIDIISGKNKLSISVQDFDPLELVPLIHSLSAQEVVQGKETGKKESMDQVFKRTSINRNKSRGTTASSTAEGKKAAGGDNALLNQVAAFGNF